MQRGTGGVFAGLWGRLKRLPKGPVYLVSLGVNMLLFAQHLGVKPKRMDDGSIEYVTRNLERVDGQWTTIETQISSFGVVLGFGSVLALATICWMNPPKLFGKTSPELTWGGRLLGASPAVFVALTQFVHWRALI